MHTRASHSFLTIALMFAAGNLTAPLVAGQATAGELTTLLRMHVERRTWTEPGRPLIVTLGADGGYLIDAHPVGNIWQMLTMLDAITQSNRDAKIYFRPQSDTPYHLISDLMKAMSAAGYRHATLIAPL